MSFIIVIALLAIVAALFFAGRAMLKDSGDSRNASHRMVRALTWRIGLSVALFLFILLSWKLGWIQPTGIQAGR